MNSFLIRFEPISTSDLDNTTLSAVFAYDPPAKAERGKESIRLMVTILLKGNKEIDPADGKILANTLAATFYKTAGPVTSALKAMIEQFNRSLFEGNMQTTSKGVFQNGHIVVLALRDDSLYVVQSGLSKVYHVTQLSKVFYDPALAGKGAGLSSTSRMYFAQAQVDDTDKFIVVFDPEENVEKGVESLRQLSTIESIHRRLVSLAEEPVFGAIFEFRKQERAEYFTSSAVVEQNETTSEQADEEIQSGSEDTIADESLGTEVEPERVDRIPTPPRADKQTLRKQVRNSHGVAEWLLKVLSATRTAIGASRGLMGDLADQLTPEGEEDAEHPNKTYRNVSIIFAVVVPVLLMAFAYYYYSAFGYEAKYNAHLDNAEDHLAAAANTGDIVEQKAQYNLALDEIELARESIGKLDQRGENLYAETIGTLDALEGVSRLNYEQVLSQSLPSDHNISQITINGTDIYLLDQTDDLVIRERWNGTRYDKDKQFICGSSSIMTDNSPGKLLAILPLPSGYNSGFTVMAVAQSGQLVYCGPGLSPVSEDLLLPAKGIQSIDAVAIQGPTMLILDSAGRSIWKYNLGIDGKFDTEPNFYFTDDIPSGISNAKKLAFLDDKVVMLSSGGEVILCSSTAAGIRCESPYQFEDTRQGMTGGSTFSDGVFDQVAIAELPTSTVLFLDKDQKAVFRFSLRSMAFQKKYLMEPVGLSDTHSGSSIRAFTVNNTNQVFVLINGQVYVAKLFE